MRPLGNGLWIDENGTVSGVRVANHRKRKHKLSFGAQQVLARMRDRQIAQATQARTEVKEAFAIVRNVQRENE